MTESILLAATAIVVLGMVAQVLTDRYRVPSVLFLIVSGIVLGPEMLGFITPETFGEGLFTVGTLVMLLGTAAAVFVFLDTTWEVALPIGALLVTTGPTVITPVLSVVSVREHVAQGRGDRQRRLGGDPPGRRLRNPSARRR